MQTLEGIVIWTGTATSEVRALVWAEDGGTLVYVHRAVAATPADWTPEVGDHVSLRVVEAGGERRAIRIERVPEGGRRPAIEHLREVLNARR